MATNKTDANDADGLAQLAEAGFFREVRAKGFDSMLSRTLIAARTKLVRATLDIASQIRGLMNTIRTARADFGRKLVRRLAHIGSTFSGVGAYDKPDAVQYCG